MLTIRKLRKYIALLYQARNSTAEDKAKIVADIDRRGFLKTIVTIASYAVVSKVAFADGDESNSFDGTLPDMGDFDRSNLSIREADFIGLQVIQSLQGQMLDDYDTLWYLNYLGNLLLSHSAMAGSDFNFYLMKDKVINAFALPGGYICVNNGLIYATLTEAELASVLAHEISHVIQHHIYRNISVYNRSQWMAIVGVLAAGAMAVINPGAAVLMASGGQGLAIQNMLSFSRDFENEADRVGQKILYNSGFNAHAMPEFFARLSKQEQFNNNDALAFLRTHPVTSQRLSEATARADQLPTKMREDSVSFLLVREKCRVRQLGADVCIGFYEMALRDKKYTKIEAQYYGLGFAYFQQNKYKHALDAMAKIIAPAFQSNPIVLGLQAQLFVVTKNYKLADKLYNQALSDYPNNKTLWMGQLNLYFALKNLNKVGVLLDDLAQKYPDDLDVWDKYSLLYSDVYLNNPERYHYGIANQYYLWYNFREALSQYQLALDAKVDKKTALEQIISAKILDTQNKIKLYSQ